MDELIAFFRERLAEEEAAAEACPHRSWRADNVEVYVSSDDPGTENAYVAVGPWDGPMDEADAAHIVRHDPASVLADVAADRKLLAMHEGQRDYDLPEGTRDGRDQEERWIDQAVKEALGEVIKVRAGRFSGHPGYPAG